MGTIFQVNESNGNTTITGSLTMSSNQIHSVTDPTSAQDAATKNYVDNVAIAGVEWKAAVRLATTTALPSNIYANGSSGVGATLTATANGALSVDSVAVAVSDRILVKNEATASHNGIYTVTATGDGSNPYVLTRATDYNTSTLIAAGTVVATFAGSSLADTVWIQTNVVTTVGTSSVTFSQFGQTFPITVSNGGTGDSTLTAHAVLLGEGTSSVAFASPGTTAYPLVSNGASSDPSFQQLSLTAGVTGTLPIANGGTNNSTAYTSGSVIFSNGTSLTQDNVNLFWDNSTKRLGIGTSSPASALDVGGGTITAGSLTTSGTITSNGDIRINGALELNFTTVTTSTTLTSASTSVQLVDATSGPVTITLPTLSVFNKGTFTFVKIDSSANAVTILRAASDTIDGQTSYTLTQQYQTLSVISSTTAWYLYEGSAAGATGAVQFNNTSALSGDASNLFWDSTNHRLGIGTSSPSVPLEVNGNAKIDGNVTITNTTNQLVLGTTNTTTLSATAPSASRTYTIPDAGGAANIVLDKGNYTIGGTWTFNNDTTLASSKKLILTDNTTNTVALKATNSTTSWTLSLPTTAGTSNFFLQTDGSGNTTWASGGSGTISSGTTGNVAYYTGSTTIGSSTITNTQLTYLPNLFSYRRPVLTYSSSTVVSVETGLDGTSGDAVILFPDGNLRTETSSSRYNMTISQNAVFNNATLGNNQGGLRTGSATSNTWYACYAVKVSTFAANWVLVADTVLPIQANYSTLNTNFGTNSWVHLGLIRYGNGLSGDTGILEFWQVGNYTIFNNAFTGTNTTNSLPGILMATSASASTLQWAYAAGTSGAVLPNNIYAATYTGSSGVTASNSVHLEDNAINGRRLQVVGSNTATTILSVTLPAGTNRGAELATTGGAPVGDLAVSAFWDGVLGVGPNPLM